MPLASGAAKADVNILFTSAGRRVELLRAFHRAYDELGLAGRIVATDIQPLAPALRIADKQYLVPPFREAGYIPAVIDIIQREKISLVFPLIDPDIPILAKHRESIEAAGAVVMAPPHAGAEIAADKWKTHLLFRDCGVPAAKSWLPDELKSAAFSFPLFIKPRHGSAGQGAFRIENEKQLAFFIDYVDDPIIQECLPGPEITSDVLCSAKGEVWSVVSRKRLEIRAGEVSKGVTVWDEHIAKWCSDIAVGLHASGPITVQCILREGQPFFTEVNARYGGGCPLGFAAGVPSPTWYLAEAAGLSFAIPALGTYRRGLSFSRFDDSFFYNE
jgi:carbamoyl-phosphate synthase large subunit